MPPSNASSRGGYDRDAFETELAALVKRVRTAGVDMEGGYDVRADDESPDYTIEVFEVVPQSFERSG